MDLLLVSQPRPPPNASLVTLLDELLAEVLSLLPVKSLMRLRSVNKSWKSLISDPAFFKLHFTRSARKPELTLVSSAGVWIFAPGNGVVSFTVCRLFEDPPIIINLPNDPYYQLEDKDCVHIIGSCSGLLCLIGVGNNNYLEYKDMFIRIWNPTKRTISEKLGYLCDGDENDDNDLSFPRTCFGLKFAFSYDNSSNTYKVVYFILETTIVRVFSLEHNVWRNIQDSLVAMHTWTNVVDMSGSVVWVAVRNCNCRGYYNCNDITIEQFFII